MPLDTDTTERELRDAIVATLTGFPATADLPAILKGHYVAAGRAFVTVEALEFYRVLISDPRQEGLLAIVALDDGGDWYVEEPGGSEIEVLAWIGSEDLEAPAEPPTEPGAPSWWHAEANPPMTEWQAETADLRDGDES